MPASLLGTSHESQRAHARAVLAGRRAALPDEPLPQEIIDSWARCLDAGLDFSLRPELPMVDHAALQRRREQSSRVRHLALIELESLFHQIAGSNFLLAFADPDGILLDLYADNRFATSSSGEGILPGSQWTESAAGTNGLGTALASGRPVAVNGPEHFFGSLGDISCIASPIRDADGRIVGALDASSYFEHRQRHTQALVQMAATQVENVLLAEQRAGDVVIAIHPRPEFVGTISAGLIALDGEGRVSAFNARATTLLAGLELGRGAHFEALFNEPYERFLGRLHAGSDGRLRDALGSVLAASWINRRLRVGRAAATVTAAGAATPTGPGTSPASGPTTPLASRPTSSPTTGRATSLTTSPVTTPATAPGPRPDFVAEDAAVRAAVETVNAAARRGLPILIHGETGCGKELLARHAHVASGRRGAFVAVNCGALPSELFEAELFGYVGGAYTGARREGNEGLLASADGGTLLLDEVRELPLPLQAALLRFLDDRLVRPVGGHKARHIDVQLLAASNADLAIEVAARRFRADLLYRLDTIRVELPPLRQRSDFAATVRFVLRQIDAGAAITPAAIALLATHDWPGNFRELRSVLTRALLLQPAAAPLIDGADLRPLLPARSVAVAVAVAAAGRLPTGGSALQHGATEIVLHEFSRTGSVSQTSRNLGISRTTVYRHLREGGAEPAARLR